MKKSNKRQKNKPRRAKRSGSRPKALGKKVKKKQIKREGKTLKSKKSAKPKFLTKKKIDEALKMERLILRGKERGFVTFDEILKEFPTIETNIMFLDDLYEKLHALGVDILEGGGLLEMPEEETGKHHAYSRGDSSYDSIQMYLREIGQYPLIAGSMKMEMRMPRIY